MLLIAATRSRPLELALLVGYLLTVAALGKAAQQRRRRHLVPTRPGRRRSAPKLERVPRRDGKELEESAPAARVSVGEVGGAVVPRHLEEPFLDAVVEPGTPKHELPDPVDERLSLDDRDPLPVPHEVVAEGAAGLADLPVRHELDEIGGLLGLELVPPDEPELDGRRGDALLEVEGAEGEAVVEELDDEIGAGVVVGLGHDDEEYDDEMDDYEEDIPAPPLSRSAVRRIARAVLACSAIVFVGIMAIFRLPLQETPLLAPVVLAFAGAGLTLLSLRARERAEQPDV
jgi:hypothetical protein